MISTRPFYVPHCRRCTRCFATFFRRSHYQLQNWCRFANSKLRFDMYGQAKDNWRFKTILTPLVKYNGTQSIMCLQIGSWPAEAVIWMRLFTIIYKGLRFEIKKNFEENSQFFIAFKKMFFGGSCSKSPKGLKNHNSYKM